MFLFFIKFYFKEYFMKNSQLKILFFMLILAAAAPLFAQTIVPAGLESMSTQIEEVFKSKIVTDILVACLCGCGIAYAFNKDNDKMKRNVIAIGVGIIIIGAAKEVVAAVMSAAK
jgi:type IV secretory pathway VirB2 component (pilin)